MDSTFGVARAAWLLVGQFAGWPHLSPCHLATGLKHKLKQMTIRDN